MKRFLLLIFVLFSFGSTFGQSRNHPITNPYEWVAQKKQGTAVTRLTPDLTSNVSSFPIVVSGSSILSSTYDVYKAFNSDTTTSGNMWATNSTNTGWVIVNLGTPHIVTGYAIIATLATYSTDFKTWTFYGSTDSLVWVSLHSVTNAPTWGDVERRQYSFANIVAYQYYKWNVTANYGGIYVEAVCLRLYGY